MFSYLNDDARFGILSSFYISKAPIWDHFHILFFLPPIFQIARAGNFFEIDILEVRSEISAPKDIIMAGGEMGWLTKWWLQPALVHIQWKNTLVLKNSPLKDFKNPSVSYVPIPKTRIWRETKSDKKSGLTLLLENRDLFRVLRSIPLGPGEVCSCTVHCPGIVTLINMDSVVHVATALIHVLVLTLVYSPLIEREHDCTAHRIFFKYRLGMT